MSYETFLKNVEEKLQETLGEGVEISQNTLRNNNGQIRQGITICKEGCSTAPTVYMEEYYSAYCKGKLIKEIAEEIAKFCVMLEQYPEARLDWMSDYKKAKWRIVPKLISKEKNAEILEQIPFVDWMDLAVVFYLLLHEDGRGTVSMTVQNAHLEEWGVTKEEVYQMAVENAEYLLPAKLVAVEDLLEEEESKMLPESILPAEILEEKNLLDKKFLEAEQETEGMYVLTNSLQNYGAACILYPKMPEKIEKLLGEDYYILPSSIHEMLIVPQQYSVGQEAFGRMICEINETQMLPEEVLGDHSYFYRAEKGELSM